MSGEYITSDWFKNTYLCKIRWYLSPKMVCASGLKFSTVMRSQAIGFELQLKDLKPDLLCINLVTTIHASASMMMSFALLIDAQKASSLVPRSWLNTHCRHCNKVRRRFTRHLESNLIVPEILEYWFHAQQKFSRWCLLLTILMYQEIWNIKLTCNKSLENCPPRSHLTEKNSPCSKPAPWHQRRYSRCTKRLGRMVLRTT